MTAGGTILDDEIGKFLAQFAEEFLDTLQMLSQPFAGRLGSIDSEADGFVVINLQVAESVVAKQMDHFFREVIEGARVAEIPETPACIQHSSIATQQGVFLGRPLG